MTTASLSSSIESLVECYKKTILDVSYKPTNLLDAFKAHFTALILMHLEEDLFLKNAARDFLKKTASEQSDLTSFHDFSTLTALDSLEILSTYTNGLGSFVEYTLMGRVAEERTVLHRHALFQSKLNTFLYINETPPLVRVIGDPILHKPGKAFPSEPTRQEKIELEKQIELAKDILIRTHGAGIAANQCAQIETPYSFTIVGVFKDNLHHVQGVNKRYPGVDFPEAVIMVNPKILHQSQTKQSFKHACLSVPCPNRCEILSPSAFTIEYQDPQKNMETCIDTFEKTAAIAVWHELNHILDGKTYFNTMLESLSGKDLERFELTVNEELIRRSQTLTIPDLSVPPFHVSVFISDEGEAKLDEKELLEVLPKLTKETLEGVLSQCQTLKRGRSRPYALFSTSLADNSEQHYGVGLGFGSTN